MSKQRWFDCNGVELHEGDTVRHAGSSREEQVYACHSVEDPDIETLGVNASNEAFLKQHPEWTREVYPFSNFQYRTVNGERHLVFYEKVVK